MGYHRIFRFVSTEPIQLECPECGDDVDIWPADTTAECYCGAEFSVARDAKGVSLVSEPDPDEDDWQVPKKLYHGTSLKRFRDMLAKPEAFELYLADDPDGTEGYATEAAAMDDGSEPVTITFDTQKLLSLGKLMPDWDDVDTMISNGETDAEGNPLFGDAGSAQEVMWQESLRIINTCSYEGPVLGAIVEADINGRIEKPPFGKLSSLMPPTKLYHGTFGWNSDAILEGGITPGQNPNWNLSDPQYVYLTESPELAANWVREAYEGGDIELDWDRATAVVFEVDATVLDVEHDPKSGGSDWRHEGIIPPSSIHLVYECDYTDDIPDPIPRRQGPPPADGGWRGASRWWRAAAMVGDAEPTVSFDFDDVLHYAPDGNPIDFWTPESYVPRKRYMAELRSLSAGHRVIIVSHRDPGMEDVVYEFARLHGLDIDAVFCLGVQGSKRRTLEDEDATLHYDDSPYVEKELHESTVELVKVPRTAINDLTWVPDDMWDKFPEIYRAYAERVGVTAP